MLSVDRISSTPPPSPSTHRRPPRTASESSAARCQTCSPCAACRPPAGQCATARTCLPPTARAPCGSRCTTAPGTDIPQAAARPSACRTRLARARRAGVCHWCRDWQMEWKQGRRRHMRLRLVHVCGRGQQVELGPGALTVPRLLSS
eukprot:228808-Chlamydomonas_euryale.AAC.1